MIKLHSNEEKRIIGLMSGTSLDGLDMACTLFPALRNSSPFTLEHAETVPLPPQLKSDLESIETLHARAIFQLNQQLGVFFAESVNHFLQKYEISRASVDAIASHGQTIFHQPEAGFTVQLGCGSTLAYRTGIPVINNFRSLDVAAGGQGAPLVPLGDAMLFGNEADAFLNLGGFTNLSFRQGDTIRAFDVSPGNLPLNRYAQCFGKAYDEGGHLASSHASDPGLLAQLNALPFYTEDGPKSLGTEWLHLSFYPVLPSDINPGIALATITEHIAMQIAKMLHRQALDNVFITGGGALNSFLMQQLKSHYKGELILPAEEIIHFKEAIVFAFLGKRFIEQQFNCLSSVTGAAESVCGGTLHFPR